MAKLVLTLTSLALCLNYSVLAAGAIIPRSFPSCGYVGRQIYCFGGETSASLGSNTVDIKLYSLNINQFVGKTSDSMSSQWEEVIPAVTFVVGPRKSPTSIVLPGRERFLIQGGYQTDGFKFHNQSVIYDTVSNTWSKARSYVEGYGTRQIYRSTAVNLPNDLIGFYGGLEQLANISSPIITSTGDIMPFDAKNGSYAGFTNLTMITSGSTMWSVYSPQNNPPANFYPNSQSATINPSTGKIYYLGGQYYTPFSNGIPSRIPLSWAIVFETKSGSWLNETLTGTIPSDRLYHTADLLPNSQDIILYGGSDDGLTASEDYCFTLDLLSNEWTKKDDVGVPPYLSGPRFTHSAVLVHSTLFILFGRGLDGALNPSLLTIDVAHVSNISYSSIYNPSAIDTADSDYIEDNKKSDGLSKGATGGIAAGCIIAGLGIVALIFFYLRRQKKTKKASENNNSIENMNVDWDRIENHYKEIPINASHSPQFTEYTELTGNTLNSNTGAHYQSPNAIQDVESYKKFSAQPNTTPHVENSKTKPSTNTDNNYSIVKPDGS